MVNENGVKVQHYTRSGDQGPPHLHVKGNGPETKIGQNEKPIKGSPELTAEQAKVVTENKAVIRQTARKIAQYHRNNTQY